MTIHDGSKALSVYAEGIATGNASFETTTRRLVHLRQPTPIATPFRRHTPQPAPGMGSRRIHLNRPVYRGVIAHSIHIAAHARGRGIGSALLRRLFESEDAGIWTIRCGVLPDDALSIALHEKNGFRVDGVSQRIGRTHAGVWRNVAHLERRPAT